MPGAFSKKIAALDDLQAQVRNVTQLGDIGRKFQDFAGMQRRSCFYRAGPIRGFYRFWRRGGARRRHFLRICGRGGGCPRRRCFGHMRRKPEPVRPIESPGCANQSAKGCHGGGVLSHVICVNLIGNNTLPHCLPSYNTFRARDEGRILGASARFRDYQNARRSSFRSPRLLTWQPPACHYLLKGIT